jgi:hypothetical protein
VAIPIFEEGTNNCSRIALILFSVMTCENAVFCILCGVAYFIYLPFWCFWVPNITLTWALLSYWGFPQVLLDTVSTSSVDGDKYYNVSSQC